MATTSPLLDGALWYASQGWKILPCHGITEHGKCTCGRSHGDPKDIGKHAAVSEWNHVATSDPGTIEGWWRTQPLYNPAVMCRASGFFVLDIDPRSGGFESFERLDELVEGTIPHTVEAITGAYSLKGRMVRGRHLYFKIGEEVALKGNLKAEGLPGIDIKHNGYAMLMPSNHFSGVKYEWAPGKAPWEIAMADPSPELLEFLSKSKGRTRGGSGGGGGSYSGPQTAWEFVNDLEWNGQKLELDRFFNEGIEEGSRAVDIYAMACAMANKYGTTDMDRKFIETQMIRFNHEMVKPPLELDGVGGLLSHVHRAIDFVKENPSSDLSRERQRIGKELIVLTGGFASKAEPAPQQPQAITPVRYQQEKDQEPDFDNFESDHDLDALNRTVMPSVNMSLDVDAINPEEGGEMGGRSLTDTGNGRRFVDAFGREVRYTPGLGWFHWNNIYWKPDTEELSVREMAKRLSAVISAESASHEDPDAQKAIYTWANQTRSNARLSAALESANSDPRIAVDVDAWDADPYLLGVSNGVVDLRTGDLIQGDPNQHITRRAPTAYRPGLTSERFQKFLDFATGGDKEFQDWLQRLVGYTLTGLRTYDIMILVYGPAGSGKNTFVETIVKMLGTKQYAFPLDSMILAQGDGKSNASDMYHWAELRGRRMIWVDELPESERLKENAVKKLTGSDEISARSPGEKPFTFASQGKLWITTNHRPIITDDAMWRRIRPIPWMNVAETPDPTLKAYLHDPEGGLPAVLAWAVEGAINLLKSKEVDALGWCKVVSDAAEMYRKNEDRMGMFLDEETKEDPTGSIPIKALYVVYKTWSEDRGEKAMSQIAFTRKLTDRGLKIQGSGGRAEVLERNIRPQPAPSGINWALAAKMARD